MSLRRQAEYLAIAERMAYANPRVVAFSQYLMRDDEPRERLADRALLRLRDRAQDVEAASRKPAYDGFILPLAVKQYGSSDVLWGRVRPATGPTQVTIQHKVGNGRWQRLAVIPTSGVYGFRAAHRSKQRYRARWTRPDGAKITGPPIRPY